MGVANSLAILVHIFAKLKCGKKILPCLPSSQEKLRLCRKANAKTPSAHVCLAVRTASTSLPNASCPQERCAERCDKYVVSAKKRPGAHLRLSGLHHAVFTNAQHVAMRVDEERRRREPEHLRPPPSSSVTSVLAQQRPALPGCHPRVLAAFLCSSGRSHFLDAPGQGSPLSPQRRGTCSARHWPRAPIWTKAAWALGGRPWRPTREQTSPPQQFSLVTPRLPLGSLRELVRTHPPRRSDGVAQRGLSHTRLTPPRWTSPYLTSHCAHPAKWRGNNETRASLECFK